MFFFSIYIYYGCKIDCLGSSDIFYKNREGKESTKTWESRKDSIQLIHFINFSLWLKDETSLYGKHENEPLKWCSLKNYRAAIAVTKVR